MATPDVVVYSDGACKGNPGPGGWGAVLRFVGSDGQVTEKDLFGGEAMTTNNRMELTAAIRALEALKRPCRVQLNTDSRYVMDGVTKWMSGWKKRGWLTAAKEPVKNVDLWQALEAAVARHEVDWRWVRGHSGHVDNERADALANRGCVQHVQR
jgi:ribonuclease HI